MDIFSLDQDILADRKSTFLIRIKGKKKRLNLFPGDILVVDKALPLIANKLAILVVKNKFTIDILTQDFIERDDPENGDFVWGMIKTIVRELK